MPIIVGIDEAGYGPRLGPLTLAGVAFRVPRSDLCLQKAFDSAAGDSGGETVRAIRVADSKKVYSAARGLSPLEIPVLGFLRTLWPETPGFPEPLLHLLSPGVIELLRDYPWYADRSLLLPLESSGDEVNSARRTIVRALARIGSELLWARCRVAPVGQYNSGILRHRNKAEFLYECLELLLRELWDRHGREEMAIWIGRHGGRRHYLDRLKRTFEGSAVLTEREDRDSSTYLVAGPGKRIRIGFLTNGEDREFALALASMIAKYVREGLMRLFNGYWTREIPALRPTAGYGADVPRFLAEIEQRRKELGIEKWILVRAR